MRRADVVLHIEADSAYSRMIQTRLRTLGVALETLSDPKLWQETILELNAGIILLDMNLPTHDQGLELLEKIRKLEGDRRVIMLTGSMTSSNVVQSMALGADYCFFKSAFEFQELVDAIHALQFRRFHWFRVARVASDMRRVQREVGNIAMSSNTPDNADQHLNAAYRAPVDAFSEAFPRFLLGSQHVPLESLLKATEYSDQQRPLLGQVALDLGKLDMKQIFRIVEEQSTTREPFGQVAVRLGMLTPADVELLLNAQSRRRPDIGAALVAIGVLNPAQLETYLAEFQTFNASLHGSQVAETPAPLTIPA